ncbi:fumarylacetoacetate hydrolase family protein [Cytophaga hutchinsonii]|jgi:acylpyruvate hydrolase|uniref:2-hydroxyhepta-2,4-diene-1,7-dioate isomerase, fumarylacetoacetate hydrolase family n=1 Tax=Cytophaga hutchinsonii (strain ATCC 33406 / DSM 1761 / CIP 103989 / NBRC 15051 / NCIMB 9469 / D465) TaxID=269798 RepID=A0A6N4SS12_CYTH3|nr:fumarylacetoacetate hydrolase family protein [Cytophaga hutchinsonii]ABG59157.1 2-hydroxyhepta-2,4-diene-1,7-dioate isomerase, fumarylacetoacetate hydrolase family [Cytophaga hutchinsonii ATCC 33406]SFX35388.1 2-keto-4-pentenoate hydratase/2-oxohepta-3-ene-1,7-dioic acid hydratase (catechol pathway) [Cytophaga hutchinsonii ATCC 33406]
MKIIGIGRNYSEHAKELNNPQPKAPIIFLKPDTALLKNNENFYFPSFSKDIHHEIELVVKISKEGKNIQEKFAHRYYEEIGLGIDFTARDLQQEAKEQGLPWTLAKGFNGSAPVSEFVSKSEFSDINNISFSLTINGELRQSGTTADMVFSIDFLIAYISQFITLKKGDLIYTGTPKGVGSIVIGDKLEGFLENKPMLTCEIC